MKKYKLNSCILFKCLLLSISPLVSHGPYIFYLMREKEGAFSFLPIWRNRERDNNILLRLAWYWEEESEWRLPQAESLKLWSRLSRTAFQQSCARIWPPEKTSLRKCLHYLLFKKGQGKGICYDLRNGDGWNAFLK